MVNVSNKTNRFAGLRTKTYSSLTPGTAFAWASGKHSGTDDAGGPRVKLTKTKYMVVKANGTFLICTLAKQGKKSKDSVYETGSAKFDVALTV